MAQRKAFLLRIDPALWTELEVWAQDELRSVNGQVEYVLKQAVQKRRGTGKVERGIRSSKIERVEATPMEPERNEQAGAVSAGLPSNQEAAGPVPPGPTKPEPGSPAQH